MPKRLTTDEFIKKSKLIHGNKYDYSLVEYKIGTIKVNIICPIHGMFEQKPREHLTGCGCEKCKGRLVKDTKSFIEQSNIIHHNRYDYSLVNYVGTEIEVEIICNLHGVFKQTPHHHLDGINCPDCSHNKKLTTDIFIEQSKKMHGDKYDYSLVNYKNSRTKTVQIICDKHGTFNQIPYEHKNGSGCPYCKESSGEREIRKYLVDNNIEFETQKYLEGCKHINKLKFDFYLPYYNLCIEFDGEQHKRRFRFEKNNDGLSVRQKRDQIKNEYCKNNNIRLLRIEYNDNIYEKLFELLNS